MNGIETLGSLVPTLAFDRCRPGPSWSSHSRRPVSRLRRGDRPTPPSPVAETTGSGLLRMTFGLVFSALVAQPGISCDAPEGAVIPCLSRDSRGRLSVVPPLDVHSLDDPEGPTNRLRRCQASLLVPSLRFLTPSTACSIQGLWACCIPLPTMRFVAFPVSGDLSCRSTPGRPSPFPATPYPSKSSPRLQPHHVTVAVAFLPFDSAPSVRKRSAPKRQGVPAQPAEASWCPFDSHCDEAPVPVRIRRSVRSRSPPLRRAPGASARPQTGPPPKQRVRAGMATSEANSAGRATPKACRSDL